LHFYNAGVVRFEARLSDASVGPAAIERSQPKAAASQYAAAFLQEYSGVADGNCSTAIIALHQVAKLQ
jgi:hypothetical protein